MKGNMVGPNGDLKKASTGLSWGMFFFGGSLVNPALFRGDWMWWFISGLIWWTIIGPFWLLFKYNKGHIGRLVTEGYKPADAEFESHLRSEGVIQ